MLTDEIMDQIEMAKGVPKKQERITHQSKQLTTRQTLKNDNIQESDTIDLSLELHGGIATTDPTEQPTMDTEKFATRTHTDAPTTERKPPKRGASDAGVDVPESADVDTIVEHLRNDMERLAKQNHEEVMTLANQNAKQNHEAVMTFGKTE